MVVKNNNPTYRYAAWHLGFEKTKFNFYTGITERLAEPEVHRYQPFSTFSYSLGHNRSVAAHPDGWSLDNRPGYSSRLIRCPTHRSSSTLRRKAALGSHIVVMPLFVDRRMNLVPSRYW